MKRQRNDCHHRHSIPRLAEDVIVGVIPSLMRFKWPYYRRISSVIVSALLRTTLLGGKLISVQFYLLHHVRDKSGEQI
jgi:hypothetical protein